MAPVSFESEEAPSLLLEQSTANAIDTPQPTSQVDWEKMNFTYEHSNGHVESTFSVATGEWTTPEFVSDPYLRIHGLAPGLNYGQQIYEGLKAFRDPQGKINIFRPEEHAKRMQHSASAVLIPPAPASHFLRCVNMAVWRNAEYVPPHGSGAAMYIRPLCFGSGPQLQLSPPAEFKLVVFVQPSPPYHGLKPLPCLVMDEFDRAAPRGTGGAKVGGNYAPVIPWSAKAYKMGFPMTLHLDSKTRTEVEEFSTSGFIGIKEEADGSVIMCIPDTKNAIASITSKTCVELAESWGWKVEKRSILYKELADFFEVCAAGTAAALVSISSITCHSTNDKFEYPEAGTDGGKYRNRLLQAIFSRQQGTAADEFGWLREVTSDLE